MQRRQLPGREFPLYGLHRAGDLIDSFAKLLQILGVHLNEPSNTVNGVVRLRHEPGKALLRLFNLVPKRQKIDLLATGIDRSHFHCVLNCLKALF